MSFRAVRYVNKKNSAQRQLLRCGKISTGNTVFSFYRMGEKIQTKKGSEASTKNFESEHPLINDMESAKFAPLRMRAGLAESEDQLMDDMALVEFDISRVSAVIAEWDALNRTGELGVGEVNLAHLRELISAAPKPRNKLDFKFLS
jgi:hypothetical protein